MPRENVEIVRDLAAFSRGDVESAIARIHPAVVLDASHRVDGRIGRGREEARGKESGVEWEHRFAMLFEFDGGRVTRGTIYDDLDAARAGIERTSRPRSAPLPRPSSRPARPR